jgi:hypothetical protein
MVIDQTTHPTRSCRTRHRYFFSSFYNHKSVVLVSQWSRAIPLFMTFAEMESGSLVVLVLRGVSFYLEPLTEIYFPIPTTADGLCLAKYTPIYPAAERPSIPPLSPCSSLKKVGNSYVHPPSLLFPFSLCLSNSFALSASLAQNPHNSATKTR